MKNKIGAFILIAMIFYSCSVFHKKSPESLALSAMKYADKKDYEKAYKYYSKAIVLEPMFYQAYYDRANVEILRGDSLNKERAIDDLGMYINANSSNPQSKELLSKAYFKRGQIMFKMGYKSDACDDWNAACVLNQAESPSACEQYRIHCR